MADAAKPLPPGEYPPLRGAALVILSLAIGVSSFMEILDMTIVNVSIPSIAGSLGVSPAEGTWSISSYLLAAAVVQPLAGWIGRRFGEVRTFVTSILLFVVFSMICGMATTMPMLVRRTMSSWLARWAVLRTRAGSASIIAVTSGRCVSSLDSFYS